MSRSVGQESCVLAGVFRAMTLIETEQSQNSQLQERQTANQYIAAPRKRRNKYHRARKCTFKRDLASPARLHS